MEKKTVHDKAIRLIEGGIVEIEGNWFRLKRLPKYFDDNTCNECELDSMCHWEHVQICEECEAISNQRCMLVLASTGR